MQNIRYRIEEWFASFADFIFDNRLKAIMLMLGITLACISQLPKIAIDTSTEGFLHKKDPILLDYNHFRDQFGRDEVVIVAIKTPNVFDPIFLGKLKEIHEALESEVPYIDDITSLINARNTRGEADTLIVEDLMEKWPKTQADLAELKRRVMSNRMYRNMLISESGGFVTIVIRTQSMSSQGENMDPLTGFDDEPETIPVSDITENPAPKYLTDAENSEVVRAAQDIVDRFQSSENPIYLAGSPSVTHFLKQSLMNDMRKFVVLSLLIVAVVLYFMFRRVSGFILPLVVVILSLLTTMAIMAMTGTAIKVPTQILPSFLLAVGVGTSVHILAIFYQRFDQKGDKREAIAYALSHSGLAVIMTNITTASGLMSFSTAEVAPVADIGIFAGIGVLLAFVYTLVLIPAFLSLIPLKPQSHARKQGQISMMDRFLKAVGSFSTRRPWPILIVSGVIIVVSLFFASQLTFSHHPLGWFPENNPVRVASETIDEELRGSLSLEVIIDTGKENGLYDPDLLQRLDKAADYMETLDYGVYFVGKAWSLTSILKETNQALNENRKPFYRVPQDRDLVAQELLLFENSGSDDLEDLVDSQFSKARLTLKVPFRDVILSADLLRDVPAYFEENFPEADIMLTGLMSLLGRILVQAVHTMAKSYVIAIVIITILMIILIGKLRIGLLSMIPNLTPILLTLGLIKVLGFPLDLFTMMVASIAIGLAVDDTIHFMHNFRRYYETGQDAEKAVFDTLHTTGRAMLVTTIVLSLGFFIFMFATMNNLTSFGLLTGFTIIMALASDYLIAPALMVVVNPKPQSTT
jgi:uncharacterized protein